jgi:hypothetical protein
MRDAPNWVWGLIFGGFIVWLVLVLAVIDPLLRKLILDHFGVDICRTRPTGTAFQWSSATPGRGGWADWLWGPFVYFLIALPFIIGFVVAILRWYATHKK